MANLAVKITPNFWTTFGYSYHSLESGKVCQLFNFIKFSFSESNTIQKPVEVVIQDESRLNELGYCPGTTSRNVEWNWTKPGETAILPCPLGKYIIH